MHDGPQRGPGEREPVSIPVGCDVRITPRLWCLRPRALCLQWGLENFSKQRGLVQSPVFQIAGLDWHLNIYPGGNKKLVSAAARGLSLSKPSLISAPCRASLTLNQPK